MSRICFVTFQWRLDFRQIAYIQEHIAMTPTGTGLLSGVPDYFDRKKISSGGDLSHYSSASLY